MAGTIVNNYGSLPVVFASGEGATLTDVNGKTYIDFTAGIGVNCLGHNHRALVRAVQEQAAKAIHVSNYYNSDKGLAFADGLLKATGMERVYFGNSGAEANEAAIKLSRKYGWMQGGTKARNVIISLEKSFHGRTLATLAVTGQKVFHPPCFGPYLSGFRTIAMNDFDALKTAFNETICALFIECVQGEGGVNLMAADWAKAAVQVARDAGALIVADEVQTGIGRTGTFLASEQLGIEPDIITLAKGIAGGIPMGACLFRGNKLREVFVAGDHQSTFAGNPLASAAGLVVLDELLSDGFLSRVTRAGQRIRDEIASWNLPVVTNIRGAGLMIGVDITAEAAPVQKKCLGAGLCISTAGAKTLRFLPPLVISDSEIDAGLSILRQVLCAE